MQKVCKNLFHKSAKTAQRRGLFAVFLFLEKFLKKSVKPIDKVGKVCYNHINLVNR